MPFRITLESTTMIIGISGHQNLGDESSVAWVADQMRRLLQETPFDLGSTSLAAGADQLFAEIVLELGRPFEFVSPSLHYEKAFTDPAAREKFLRLERQAKVRWDLPFSEPGGEAFLQAGQCVVDHADLMLFVWNGLPAKGRGGTADVVAYARARGKSYLLLDPNVRSVARVTM